MNGVRDGRVWGQNSNKKKYQEQQRPETVAQTVCIRTLHLYKHSVQ